MDLFEDYSSCSSGRGETLKDGPLWLIKHDHDDTAWLIRNKRGCVSYVNRLEEVDPRVMI